LDLQRVSCRPARQAAPVFRLRKGAVEGAKAANTVYVRFAGLGGCAAGPARVPCRPARQATPIFALRRGAVEGTEEERQQAQFMCGLLALVVVLLG
jgi:hypothetical protein